MMHTRRMVLPLILTLLAITSIVHAEVYRWVDDNGQVHYGDRPQNEDVEEIKIPSAPEKSAAQQASEKQRLEQQRELIKSYNQASDEEKEKLNAKAKDEAQREKNCQALKKSLAEYSSARHMYKKDAKGERQYLDEAEKKREINKYIAEINKQCQ